MVVNIEQLKKGDVVQVKMSYSDGLYLCKIRSVELHGFYAWYGHKVSNISSGGYFGKKDIVSIEPWEIKPDVFITNRT